MRKVVCVVKCYDGKKVWEVGESKVIADGVPVPAHFKFAEDIKPVEPPKLNDPMKPINAKPGEILTPKGGMGAGLGILRVNPMPTAGSEAIRKAKEAELVSKEPSVLQNIIKRAPGRPKKS